MTVRLGLLARSRIAGPAIIDPIDGVDGIEVVAVAARDRARADAAAAEWGLDRAHGSYQELIDDPDVDAVYVATPASLHRRWAIAALEAGKHVLCEKPLASNADDGRAIAAVADASSLVAMEAYHWRYHPFADEIASVLADRPVGRVDRIDAAFDIPEGWIPQSDIRWDLALGGGATMDLGCYALQWVRFAAGSDPDVVSAEATCVVPQLDAALEADLRWPSGVIGRVHSSMVAPGDSVEAWLRVTGERGTVTVTNPLAPQHGGAVIVTDLRDRVINRTTSTTSTYHHQLVAFRDAIVDGAPFPTTIADGVRTMELVDACYRVAGLPVRPTDSNDDR